jgi:PAS domain S-box-containing protein
VIENAASSPFESRSVNRTDFVKRTMSSQFRATDEIALENESLRGRVAELTARLAALAHLDRDFAAERAFLQNIIVLNPYAIQILDRDGRHVMANDAFRGLFGGEPPAGWSVLEDAQINALTGPGEVQKLRDGKILRMCVESPFNPSKSLPNDAVRAPDRTVWIKTVAFPVFDAHGEITRFVVMHENITDRKRAEQSLRSAEGRFRSLIEKSTDLIAIVDADGAAVYVSGSIEPVLGWTPEELLGKPIMSLVHPEDRALVRDGMVRCLAAVSGEPVFAAPRMRHKNGAFRRLECTGRNLIRDATVGGVVLNARDVTERETAQARQQAVEAKLRQAERLDALGALAGGIAHDFNTVLAIIHGFAEETLADVAADSGVARNQEQILTAVKRARGLVEQILTFSRAEAGTVKRPVAMNRIVHETLNMLAGCIPRSIKIVRRLDPAAGHVVADPSEIQQIVINLCTNAHFAMEQTGGTLTVSVAPVQLAAGQRLDAPLALAAGFYCRLTVSDTGSGMDSATIARIFEPFFTTKPVGQGTGMGLAVVHGIVKSHGGDILVESGPGEGSAFHVFLPQTEEVERDEIEEPGGLPLGSERILLVDDQLQMVAVYKAMLERLGYQVTCFTSSVRALNAFLKNLTAFDLVVTDQVMPKLTGLALARRIRERHADLPILLTSAHEKKHILDEIDRISHVRFLRKPFSKQVLATTVRKMLDRPAAPAAAPPQGSD